MVTILLTGDVMTGRGVDQILPDPGEPRLWERHVDDARSYVTLAEATSGPIPRFAPFSYPWGDAIQTVEEAAPAARVINLETSLTTSGQAAPEKPVHYRMNPANVGCLTAFAPDVCALANNHVLDFGQPGLIETLATLKGAGLRAAGAGTDRHQAHEPVIVPAAMGARIVVAAAGAPSSGIPSSWAATAKKAGVAYLPDLSKGCADRLCDPARQVKRAGDIVVTSLHWGSNWGYQVTPAQVRFAHRLIDRGVDVVHGHSSHHPRPIELYRGKLILYGCGNLIDDYEGISGYEQFRDDLRLLYLATVDPDSGRLARLTMIPMQSRRMRLQPASAQDVRWLRHTIQDANLTFHTQIDIETDRLVLGQPGAA